MKRITNVTTTLIYLGILVNGRSTMVVDTGATYKFVSLKEASITLQKGKLHMKAVHLKVEPIHRVAQVVTNDQKLVGKFQYLNGTNG